VKGFANTRLAKLPWRDSDAFLGKEQMATNAKNRMSAMVEELAITEITVGGFKSISEAQSIEIRPLTVLAGVNSSGKSSMMQPLLLLKQTLEAAYDPGPLLLNGPNTKFTSADQMLSRIGRGQSSDIFQVGIRVKYGEGFQTTFRKEHRQAFRIEQIDLTLAPGNTSQKALTKSTNTFTLSPDMTSAEIIKTGITKGLRYTRAGIDIKPRWKMNRDRSFLDLGCFIQSTEGGNEVLVSQSTSGNLVRVIQHVIHVPGLRGNPERSYPVTAVGATYPGTFEKYTASVLSQWMEENKDRVDELNSDLKFLKLTGGVFAKQLNGVQIEVWVGRLPDVPPTRPEDRVNIADVGFGVSQTLPILVALRVALPGQLVYVEQPETHLHPNAQFALAQILANAANRGVRVVVETHSSILLLGVQTLVAEGSLAPDKVKLHWFERKREGNTVVHSGELDDAGRFGDWPEDFDDISLKAESRFLDAAEAKIAHK
jgi:hypothetical protein